MIVQGGKISNFAKSFIVGILDAQIHFLVQISPDFSPTGLGRGINLHSDLCGSSNTVSCHNLSHNRAVISNVTFR